MAPVSSAERQRQCRERLNADPERTEKHLQKERERWRQKKERRESIHEFNERDQRQSANYGESNRTNLGLRERCQFQGQGLQGLSLDYHFILQLCINRVIPW